MAETLTIRLDPEQRRQFDAEARSRGVGPSTLARELLSERLREIRRAKIYRESKEAGERYHAALAARERGEPHEDVEIWELESGATDYLPPYEGAVGSARP
jgi:predicted transcriptional regulator